MGVSKKIAPCPATTAPFKNGKRCHVWAGGRVCLGCYKSKEEVRGYKPDKRR